ncbi:hypothetical protein J7E83_01975 [Arthrobacter sp. ISL-48]|uniref:hypothetical protein n=1 Tax=Arthrobacter sp. ISL-48 TaxID=2819110 RepID=UPI001BEB13E5|nr:hypothetical protein [Arthrobacter sp. ISL-48]MBT2530910.1 hypothetical protein [Arthrobacter sp. ISL-48]
MSTSLLVPGAELPISGKPFGDIPALDIDYLRRRIRRKALNATLVLPVLFALAFAIFWHVGQPFWGNWPQVDATVTSHYEYVTKGVRCSLGLDYLVDGQRLHGDFSVTLPCDGAPAVGSVVKLGVSPEDHGWVAVAGYPGLPTFQLLLTGMGLGFPVSGCALFTFFAIRRLRRVVRLGAGPWQAVTGTVLASLPSSNGLWLALTLAVSGSPDVEVGFGLKGIEFFPLPAAGSTFTLHLAGDGKGRVLVGIPGHWGESVGTIRALPAHKLAAE